MINVSPTLFGISMSALLSVASISYAEPNQTIAFGVVPQFDHRKILKIWKPVLGEIQVRTGIRFKLQGSSSIPDFEKRLMNGQFDCAYMNPYHFLKATEAQGYTPLIKDNGKKLFGIIVVRKKSPIRHISELKNKKIAFPAPNALGASLLPRAELGETYKLPIQAMYVKNHSSVYLNVALGKADAGGGVQKTYSQQPANIRNHLRIIHQTIKVAPHPVACHPRIAKELQARIQVAFINLAKNTKGQEKLSRIPIKQAGRASYSDYKDLNNLGLEKYSIK